MAEPTPAQLAAQISSLGHNLTVQFSSLKELADGLESRVDDLEKGSGNETRLKSIEVQLAKLAKDVAALSKKK